MKIKATFALTALALLSACGSDDPAPDNGTPADGGAPAGEVLGGTISDDMLALDQLTSQSPPAEANGDMSGAADTASSDAPEPPADTLVRGQPASAAEPPAQEPPPPPETALPVAPALRPEAE
ncbi:hypothetical protein [Erythrobacter sp. MTPC3]|uniref:hypothetical protein n=1 Tax=Erythrobacter sp. MTPC3 TaxID=3056564 RepID=UPI0036F39905